MHDEVHVADFAKDSGTSHTSVSLFVCLHVCSCTQVTDFDPPPDSDLYHMECRCGSVFSFRESDFREGAVKHESFVCECDSCSQSLLVHVSAAEK